MESNGKIPQHYFRHVLETTLTQMEVDSCVDHQVN